MSNLSTYWHTVRHLKPIQFYGRLRLQLPRKLPKPADPLPLAEPSGQWVNPARPKQAKLLRGVARFLNHELDLGWPIDWRADDTPLLWQYNLHYFDYIVASDPGDSNEEESPLIIEGWVRNVPAGSNPAWDPYPTSLRIVNWIKWAMDGQELSIEARTSLATQARWLERNLEWHLLGNHLFANAKALIFAGTFFDGDEASLWRETGTRILSREIEEQILPDGGNFELSPMYHAIMLADLLDLINLSNRYGGAITASLGNGLIERAADMLEWMQRIIHPDGDIALFNDSAIGIAPDFAELSAYAKRLSLPYCDQASDQYSAECKLHFLEDSGYARLECADATAICDVARVGPDYLPGHAHADTLSFELSVGARRVIVNGGTSQYGVDAVRQRERSTAAHTTVEIDGRNSSDVWGGFRVGRRARPFGILMHARPDELHLSAKHNGYCRLHRQLVHRRVWTMTPQSLTIEDVLDGSWSHAKARFIIASDQQVSRTGPTRWVIRDAGSSGAAVVVNVYAGVAKLEPAVHSLEFGKPLRTKAFVVDLTSEGRARVEFVWQP